MNKIIISLCIHICLIGILVIPDSGFAFMTALSEAGMRSTVAQAGIALSAEDVVTLDMEIDTVALGDTGTIGENGAFMSFNDVILRGSMTAIEPVSVEVMIEPSPYTGIVDAGVNITLSDVEVDVDRFEIGSITVGTKPGEGASFGRFILKDYHAKISGDIRITTH